MSDFVSAVELNDLLTGGAPVRVIDVRWRLDRPDAGHDDYLSGHIPGAVFAALDTELATHGEAAEGRHPLPSTATLQDAARRWGVRSGDTVVAYDDFKGIAAARAWWLLRQAGVDVRVLDGGIRAWRAEGFDIATDDVSPEPGDVVLDPIGDDALSIDEAAAFPASGVLIDARAADRYRGDSEPFDPVGGHIPGARNLPEPVHFDADGKILDRETILATFAEVGVTPGTPVAAYCGSGVTAAHTALVLHEVGIEAKVFPGSWSQWSNTPGRPVAVGDQPG
ncbi:sulfurtransferase [Microbacterium oxydans]|jgi:thiosulfate/3-mercaptopyruvate sulfurtransferase|uniref:sulfurtransferase n=1 Tax=Microbacterium TaxID=33882 RepID=UPI00073437BC|nr:MULTISPECIES: sulfurtransferase [Microbacterium]KAB1892929.1 sulfurtransferase [Microbacterium oxydans]KTR75089.1 thiosulfate sulfurtransferase [Microbacterium oxydans]MBE7952778.1 sulfurtransferase [Microbacterium sp. R1]GED37342.1 sulfurtransferase [Microbacterium oxydans]